MKIALCFSGQPRDIDINYQIFKKNLLDEFDVDVFVHTWWNKDNLSHNSIIPDRVNKKFSPDAIDKIKELYKPKKIFVEKPKVWNRVYEMTEKGFNECIGWAKDAEGGIDAVKKYYGNVANSMFYSIMMSNLLKEQYSVDNNTEYDFVIRSRFDFAPYAKIDFRNITLGKNDVVCHHTPGLPYEIAHDWFAFGTTESMSVYCSVYNHISSLVERSITIDGLWTQEFLIKHHLINNNMRVYYENLSVFGHRG